MIKHIIKQIWAQRKYNTWIFIELFLVYVLLWGIVNDGFEIIHNRSIPNGYDIKDTYMIEYGLFSPGIGRYRAEYTDSLKVMENLERIVQKVKSNRQIESADLTYLGYGSIPCVGSFVGTGIKVDTISHSLQLKKVTSGDFFRIFRYKSAIDNSWERPASIDLKQNDGIIITRDLARALFKNKSAIGKTVVIGQDQNAKTYTVVDVLTDQKRFDFELPSKVGYVAAPNVTPQNLTSFAICFRLKSDVPKRKFIDDFRKTMTREMRVGNFYLKKIQSFEDKQKEIEYMFGVTNKTRIRQAFTIFLLLCIALGIIGTFWFRNQTRRGEIGLRMAMGSARHTLQKQFVLESLLLLTFAVIPALIVNYELAHLNIVKGYHSEEHLYLLQKAGLRFLITNGITYLFLALTVALSAWIPARRASKMHPVEALRDE